MASQCIDEVLQELEGLDLKATGSFKEGTCKLDECLVQEVLETIKSDKALTSLHPAIETCRNQVQQLCIKLAFIKECLPAKGSKSPPSKKEEACGKFNQSLIKNLQAITSVTNSTHLSSFLSLRTFKRLMNPLPPPRTTPVEANEYSQEELDVLTYVAGGVVASIRNTTRRKGAQDEAQCLDVLNFLVTDGPCENGGLVECLDRGGLVKVKPQVSHMFIAMEDIFNDTFMGKTLFSIHEFVRACGENDDILCGFYETVYDCSVDDAIKEVLIIQMLNLFFTIRVHQKCRVFMDKVRHNSNHSRKEKALRKKLSS